MINNKKYVDDVGIKTFADKVKEKNTKQDKSIDSLEHRSSQMEDTIKSIAATGGASQATAVTYENTESGLDSVTAQGAIDELQSKKFNKENIAQELGDSNDKVVSQFALPFREIESPEFIKAIVDAEYKVLFGIYRDTGKPYFPFNEMYEVTQNEEYLALWLDAEGKILFGIRRDGYLDGKFKNWVNQGSGIKAEDFNLEEYPDFFQI